MTEVADLRARLPQPVLDLLDGADGKYDIWSTVSAVAMRMMNAGFTEDEFIAVVSASDLAYEFVSESGRTRWYRLESRLAKVWSRVDDAWNPPLGSLDEVRRKLAELSQRLQAHKWPGRTGSTDQAVAIALVEWAHEIGTWAIDASSRDLSLRAGLARTTATNALSRLEKVQLINKANVERAHNHAQKWEIRLDWGIRGKAGPHVPLPP